MSVPKKRRGSLRSTYPNNSTCVAQRRLRFHPSLAEEKSPISRSFKTPARYERGMKKGGMKSGRTFSFRFCLVFNC